MSSQVKRGRGRPAIYTGALEAMIVGMIAVCGLTNARKVLNSSGAVRAQAEKKFGVSATYVDGDQMVRPKPLGISMVTLQKLGAKHGIELHRGRPKKEVKPQKIAA